MEGLFKRPRLIVGVVAAITIFFALQFPRLELDNNNYRFVPEQDPARVAAERIDEVFGNQTMILVGLERRRDTVLDGEFLKKVRAYGERVEELPLVGEVTSLVTADYVGGTADAIVVEPLVPEGFSGSPEEVAALRDRLLGWDLYRRGLVSDDFKSTQLLVKLDVKSSEVGGSEVIGTYKAAKRLAEEAGFSDTAIYVTGLPVFSGDINEAMGRDLRLLIPLVVLVVLVILLLSFRRLSGVLLPLLTVAISVVWAVGAMPLFGVKMTIISTVLPVILIAVASAYCLHVISHYYDELAGAQGAGAGSLDEEGRRKLVLAVLRRYGKPIFLAAFTDATGFAALCFTPVLPIYEFGVFATFGILAAFCIACSLIPALLIIRGPRRAAPAAPALPAGAKADRLSEAMASALSSISRRPRFVLALAALAAALSLAGVSRLVVDNVLVEYFKGEAEVVKSDAFIRKHFAGSKNLSVVVTGEKPGDVLDPGLLAAMDGLAEYLSTEVPEVGKVSGFPDLVKRVNQIFNADEAPEGVEPPAAAPGGEAAFGFGAGEEPAFGFGFDAAAPAPAKPAAEAQAAARPATPLDERAMIGLLSEALAEGGKRDMSADELVAALRRAANYEGAAYYEIPTDPARYAKKDSAELRGLIGNYLVLLSKDALEDVADDPLEPRRIKMGIQLRTLGQIDTDRALSAINEYVAARFPKGFQVEVGGSALVEGALTRLVVRSQLSSLPISLLMVFATLALFYRSGVAGLVGIIPLCVSILINFGVMGAFGIKLNIGTAMIASVAVGIGIDYTIHYLAAYRREYLASGGAGDYLERSFRGSGKAILMNAVSVGAGFAVLAFSQFNMLSYLGALIALTMGTSALVSLTLLPVVLELWRPAFVGRALPSERKTPSQEESK